MAIVEPPLGERMRAFGVVLHGSLTELRWVEFLKEVTRAIGMNAVAQPSVHSYPIDGKGGVGQTIFMPITESFLVLDTWSDHRGAYLLICSCRPFVSNVIDETAIDFDLTPSHEGDGRFFMQLRLGA